MAMTAAAAAADGLNRAAGGGGEGGEQDVGDEGMACSDHPFRSNPGGICAFCLQEKLGKLLSSSSSSSSSPNFESFLPAASASASASSSPCTFRSQTLSLPPRQDCDSSSRRARIPFGLSQKKKKKEKPLDHHHRHHCAVSLRRSNSTATPTHGRFLVLEGSQNRSGGVFRNWPFPYLNPRPASSARKMDKAPRDPGRNDKEKIILESADESESPNASSSSPFGRKVSRSRSVGCGNRSFSGDFFGRIGDCALRRVESHREGRPKGGVSGEHHRRVRCGGIFGGFNLAPSSSSSSPWVPSSNSSNGKACAAPWMAQVRARSWGWVLASPLRAFGRPGASKAGETKDGDAPNLAAIPSLLAVTS